VPVASSIPAVAGSPCSWRTAPGYRGSRDAPRGSDQPLVANVFLHWRSTTGCGTRIRRCRSPGMRMTRAHGGARPSQQILESIKRRLQHCRLEVHPTKTRLVYCKDDDRRGRTRLLSRLPGLHLRARRSKESPGTTSSTSVRRSYAAAKAMRQEMRRWHLPCGRQGPGDLARSESVLRGWIRIMAALPSALYSVSAIQWPAGSMGHAESTRGCVDIDVVRSTGSRRARREPRMFAHWALLGLRPAGWMMGAV